MLICHSEAGFQAPNTSGGYTDYVTFIRCPLPPQPVSSVPCGYPDMRSLPHHPRRSSFMPPSSEGFTHPRTIMVAEVTIFSVAVEAGKFIFG